ncbi:DUF167 domain-containing protein [Candidatus Uhrbacteria bacterium]|nr:DUF167 domain-containing protein [Candidatus Uhrbacteria bacterium]
MTPTTRIFVSAKPGVRDESVEVIDATHFRVTVKEPPVQGRANAAIVRVLSEHFHIAPSLVRIVSGYRSRQKIVEVIS